MLARLLPALVLAVWLEAAPFGPARVGIFLLFDQEPGPAFVRRLRAEVERIFLPSGLEFHWELLNEGRLPRTYDDLVVVEMRGACNDMQAWDALPLEGSGEVRLGWTLINDGEVLSRSVIDCDRTARAVRSRGPQRHMLPFYYARLMGRVFAHELMHALLRTPEHHDTDVTRHRLRRSELEMEARLTPEEAAALKKIGRAGGGAALAKKPSGK